FHSATPRSATSDITASVRGGFIFGREIRKMCTHMMNSRISGTAICMNTMSVKKRLVSVPVETKLRAIGSPKIGWGGRAPQEPIAGNARTVEQPDHRQAGEPGKPADAAVLIVGELPQQVGCDHYHHKVGSITVKAAHHACVKPLRAADVFDRFVGAFDAGIEENEKIDTAAGNDPEKEEAERAKLSKRIACPPG